MNSLDLVLPRRHSYVARLFVHHINTDQGKIFGNEDTGSQE
jgi:hypothetical protein